MDRSRYDPRLRDGSAVYEAGGYSSNDELDRLNTLTNDYANRLRDLAEDDDATSEDAGAELRAIAMALDAIGRDRDDPLPATLGDRSEATTSAGDEPPADEDEPPEKVPEEPKEPKKTTTTAGGKKSQ